MSGDGAAWIGDLCSPTTADWRELNEAIDATGAERIYVTHGYTEIFRRWLEERGFDARIVETEFRGEDLDDASQEAETPA